MELAQIAQAAPSGALALLGTALVLGIRHGIDWDHIAAITDITSTAATVKAAEEDMARVAQASSRGAGAVVIAPGNVGRTAGVAGVSFARIELRALFLASLYALGHALVVMLLGLAALYFEAILPDWVDPIMERVVGFTLLVLGFWVVYSLVRYWRGEDEFRLQSRWMLVFAGVRRSWAALQARLHGHSHDGHLHVHRVDQYGPRTAFGIGVIHGIGAETGTQVLIIAAIGGAASQGLGLWMLCAFVIGLLISNTAIAALTSTGFVTTSRAKALYVGAGCLAAAFSLFVGSYFFLGAANSLPDLQSTIAALFGPAGS